MDHSSLVSLYTCCMLLGAFSIPAEVASPGNLCHSMSSAPCLCSQLTSMVWKTMSSGYSQSKFGGEFLARALPLLSHRWVERGGAYTKALVLFSRLRASDHVISLCSTVVIILPWLLSAGSLCVCWKINKQVKSSNFYFFEKTFHVSYKLKYKNKYIPIQKPKQQQQIDLHIILFPVNMLVSFPSLSFWLTRLSQIFF